MSSEAKPIDSTDLESSAGDDGPTVCAISVLAAMIADVLHEGVGHATLALVTGAQSGVLSTVAWSSPFDSRLVAAGGTLVNLVAGGLFWWALRRAGNASAATRFFLLMAVAFNLFDGTGYFFFSGVTNFGDWPPWSLWESSRITLLCCWWASVSCANLGFLQTMQECAS
jgi:hypothetical protein